MRMKQPVYFYHVFLFFILILIGNSSASLAQEIKPATDHTFIESRKFEAIRETSIISLFLYPPVSYPPKTTEKLSGSVHYDSFFCKMEARNRERFNVLIKFHAGDYDAYSKACNRK
jgi:hypothetical protein